MTKTTSFGMLIVNEHEQILLAHVTGQSQWDIPKGGGKAGEEPLAAALRETFEETGLDLTGGEVEDLGLRDYLPAKALHLFRARVTTAEVDVASCRCTSYFRHRVTQKSLPEMDGFRWASVADVPTLCTPNMTRVLRELMAGEVA